MDRLLQELKKFVSSWGWTYAVVWKIGPDHRYVNPQTHWTLKFMPMWLVSSLGSSWGKINLTGWFLLPCLENGSCLAGTIELLAEADSDFKWWENPMLLLESICWNLSDSVPKTQSFCGCRTPVWHQSYFNEFEERESGQAEQFENIFKSCQFTPVRPGWVFLNGLLNLEPTFSAWWICCNAKKQFVCQKVYFCFLFKPGFSPIGESFLLPLFRYKCPGIELESMTTLDSSSIPGHLYRNRGSIWQCGSDPVNEWIPNPHVCGLQVFVFGLASAISVLVDKRARGINSSYRRKQGVVLNGMYESLVQGIGFYRHQWGA
jgi:hypothetical protein